MIITSHSTSRERPREVGAIGTTSPSAWSEPNQKTAKRLWRVSAPQIARTISAAAQAILGDRATLAVALEEAGLDADHLPSVLKSAQRWIELLRSDAEVAAAIGELVERVELGSAGVKVFLKFPVPETRGASKLDHFPLVKFRSSDVAWRRRS